MKIVADEGVDAPIVFALRKDGYEVIYIYETSRGIDDKDIIGIANKSDAVIITADKDFGELIYKNKFVSNGVILLRLHGVAPSQKAAIVQKVVQQFKEKLPNSFTVISHSYVKIRSLQ
jgi:predicted nuclease of predicted toxin-antitoxin system